MHWLTIVVCAAAVLQVPALPVPATLEVHRAVVSDTGAFAALHADFTRDGVADVVLVGPSTTALRLFRGEETETPSFTEMPATAAVLGAAVISRTGVNVAAGDLNNDGTPDIVVCSRAGCRFLLNQYPSTGTFSFFDATASTSFSEPLPIRNFVPLIVDPDNDGYGDVILMPTTGARPTRGGAVFLRGKMPAGAATAVAPLAFELQSIPGHGHATSVKMVDARRRGTAVYVVVQDMRDLYLRWNSALEQYEDQTAESGLVASATHAFSMAAADFDGDAQTVDDIVLAPPIFSLRIFLHEADGTFRDRAWETELSDTHRPVAKMVVAADFNMDGLPDILVVRNGQHPSEIFLNEGPQDATADKAASIVFSSGIPTTLFGTGFDSCGSTASMILPFERQADCYMAPDLLIVASPGDGPVQVVRFADPSRTRRVSPPSDGSPLIVPPGGCATGTAGADTLQGNRLRSILDGGDGPDTLRAMAGITIMEGGAGADTFDVRGGVAIVRLRQPDSGDTIHCGGDAHVIIDTDKTLAELTRAGVKFVSCHIEGNFGSECGDSDHDGGAPLGPPNSGDSPFGTSSGPRVLGESLQHEHSHCHAGRSRVLLVNLTPTLGLSDLKLRSPQQTMQAMQHTPFAQDLDLAYGIEGFGQCRFNSDCLVLGLSYCRTRFGKEPAANYGEFGTCFPTPIDGMEGPTTDWCKHPFYARLRYDQVQATTNTDKTRLMMRLVFWLPRSSAADDSSGFGTCTTTGDSPPAIWDWHKSVAEAVNAAQARYGKWGYAFSWRLRTFTVDAASKFVSVDNPCLTEYHYKSDSLKGGDGVGDLLAAVPNAYAPNNLNIYLADRGANAGVGAAWSDPVSFILLWGNAGALSHEIGHKLGLPHPFDNNIYPSGAAPETAESRGASWGMRPFPDENWPSSSDRLHVCTQNSDCDGIDAPPGFCRIVSDGKGMCVNLLTDASNDGDTISDTPWDSVPCWSGISTRQGAECVFNVDCQEDAGQRGVSYYSKCVGGKCTKRVCTINTDCNSGSFCVQGACTNWADGYDACCNLTPDTLPGKAHSTCWEKRDGSNVGVLVPGLSDIENMPIFHNLMAYHGTMGMASTMTAGQRDRIVCRASVSGTYGFQSGLRANGQPCSLGGNELDHAPDSFTSGKIPHGACASGVGQLSYNSMTKKTSCVCVASTCTDGVAGYGEGDRDCGGPCAAKCLVKRYCNDDSDCASGKCEVNVCQATCADGSRSGPEISPDRAGTGYDETCGGQGQGDFCKFDEDCDAGFLSLECSRKQNCITDAECAVPCTSDSDCDNGDCLEVGFEVKFCTGECHYGRCLGRCQTAGVEGGGP